MCERQTSIVRDKERIRETYSTTHPWFSSITFEPDRLPTFSKFHSALLSDQRFFDVAKAGYRATSVFAPPNPMARPLHRLHPRGRKTAVNRSWLVKTASHT